MMDYLINVAVSSRGYILFALVVFLTTSFGPAKKSLSAEVRKSVRFGCAGFAAFGLLTALISPSNTYKLTPEYNKTQDLHHQQMLNDEQIRSASSIQDISRKPSSAEQRAAGSIDMRDRVQDIQAQ